VGGAIGVILGVYRQVHTLGRTEPMALSQSDLSELLDAFRAGDGVNLIRDAVQLPPQELIETARPPSRSVLAATSAPTPARPSATVTARGCWRPRPATSR